MSAKAGCPPRASLTQLPNELTYVILGYLRLGEEFSMSHTCRHLRSFKSGDYTQLDLDSLSWEDKISFNHALSLRRLHQYVCAVCGHLHDLPLTLQNLAGKTMDTVCPILVASAMPLWQKLVACERLRPVVISEINTSFQGDWSGMVLLTERHIQVAHRLRLIQPYLGPRRLTLFNMIMERRVITFRSPAELTFIAAAKFVTFEGTTSFMVKVQWKYVGRKRCGEAVMLSGLRLCPHVGYNWESGPIYYIYQPYNGLRRVMTKLKQRAHAPMEEYGYCPYCPTDCAITADREGFEITTWRYFGGLKAPTEWDGHMLAPRRSLELILRAGNVRIYLKPGSVRHAFEQTFVLKRKRSTRQWFDLQPYVNKSVNWAAEG